MRKKVITLVAVAIVGGQAFALARPLAPLQPVKASVAVSAAPKTALPWPNYGQGAMGAAGYGVLETSRAQAPVPIASVTKIITALAVLKQKPLKPGQPGPTITLDSADVASFEYYYLNNGSVSKVTSGGKMSQYQALQAMLIPSSNNMADSLVRWAFGSTENYRVYANKMVKDLGMDKSTVGSASGFSKETKSTARDLVLLGLAVLNEPVVAGIVASEKADLPVAGPVSSTNWLLGTDGFTGIKTGSTDAAGGCFLFTSQRLVQGRKVTVVGAILDAPSRNAALSDSRLVARASDTAFGLAEPVRTGQTVGTYRLPWGGTATAIAKQDLSLLTWQDTKPVIALSLQPLKAPADKNESVGTVSISANGQKASSPVILKEAVPGPSWRWRLWP
ncbi:MAG: serine hydrolase [Candidatus Saccharimonadales bacterium]